MKPIQPNKTRGRGSRKRPARTLPVLRTDVAGIDVGAESLVACAPGLEAGTTETQMFGATTPELVKMAEWLKQRKVTSVAMESTGVYWIPAYEVLESHGLQVLLVDAQHLSRVPGRKTDVLDAEWLQTLHAAGLLNGCFRPQSEIVELRSIVRSKTNLIAERADWLRRMQKSLDQMNVRVHRAVTEIDGVTGMRMVRAIVAGERDPEKLAQLREAGCHKSEEAMVQELTGHWRADHVFVLGQGLKMYDLIGERIVEHEVEILRRMEELKCVAAQGTEVPAVQKKSKAKSMQRRGQEPLRRALYGVTGIDLTAIDGVGVETVEAIVSEYGPTLEEFPNEKAFVKHVQLAPYLNVTGGKARKGRRGRNRKTRVGEVLRMAAASAEKTATEIGAYFRHVARTNDRGTAVFATARKIATVIFRALRWGKAYVDQGAEAHEQRHKEARVRNLRRNASELGFELVPKSTVPTCA